MPFIGRQNTSAFGLENDSLARPNVVQTTAFLFAEYNSSTPFFPWNANQTVMPLTNIKFAENVDVDPQFARFKIKVNGYYNVLFQNDIEVPQGDTNPARYTQNCSLLLTRGNTSAQTIFEYDSGFIRNTGPQGLFNSGHFQYFLYLNAGDLIECATETGSSNSALSDDTTFSNVTCNYAKYVIVPAGYGK